MTFRADKLKKCRKEQMTQQKFSEKIGTSYDHYIKIENAHNKLSVPLLLEICHKLHKPAQYFFWDKNMFLSKNQFETLMQYDVDKLQLFLSLLQKLYDEKR